MTLITSSNHGYIYIYPLGTESLCLCISTYTGTALRPQARGWKFDPIGFGCKLNIITIVIFKINLSIITVIVTITITIF